MEQKYIISWGGAPLEGGPVDLVTPVNMLV